MPKYIPTAAEVAEIQGRLFEDAPSTTPVKEVAPSKTTTAKAEVKGEQPETSKPKSGESPPDITTTSPPTNPEVIPERNDMPEKHDTDEFARQLTASDHALIREERNFETRTRGLIEFGLRNGMVGVSSPIIEMKVEPATAIVTPSGVGYVDKVGRKVYRWSNGGDTLVSLLQGEEPKLRLRETEPTEVVTTCREAGPNKFDFSPLHVSERDDGLSPHDHTCIWMQDTEEVRDFMEVEARLDHAVLVRQLLREERRSRKERSVGLSFEKKSSIRKGHKEGYESELMMKALIEQLGGTYEISPRMSDFSLESPLFDARKLGGGRGTIVETPDGPVSVMEWEQEKVVEASGWFVSEGDATADLRERTITMIPAYRGQNEAEGRITPNMAREYQEEWISWKYPTSTSRYGIRQDAISKDGESTLPGHLRVTTIARMLDISRDDAVRVRRYLLDSGFAYLLREANRDKFQTETLTRRAKVAVDQADLHARWHGVSKDAVELLKLQRSGKFPTSSLKIMRITSRWDMVRTTQYLLEGWDLPIETTGKGEAETSTPDWKLLTPEGATEGAPKGVSVTTDESDSFESIMSEFGLVEDEVEEDVDTADVEDPRSLDSYISGYKIVDQMVDFKDLGDGELLEDSRRIKFDGKSLTPSEFLALPSEAVSFDELRRMKKLTKKFASVKPLSWDEYQGFKDSIWGNMPRVFGIRGNRAKMSLAVDMFRMYDDFPGFIVPKTAEARQVTGNTITMAWSKGQMRPSEFAGFVRSVISHVPEMFLVDKCDKEHLVKGTVKDAETGKVKLVMKPVLDRYTKKREIESSVWTIRPTDEVYGPQKVDRADEAELVPSKPVVVDHEREAAKSSLNLVPTTKSGRSPRKGIRVRIGRKSC